MYNTIQTIQPTAQAMTQTALQQSNKIKETVDNQGNTVTFEDPTPLGFELAPSAPFPITCLPPVFRRYAVAVAKQLNVPLAMTGTMSLSVLSAATQGTVEVLVKEDYTENTNIFTTSVAAPSERKSPMLKKMLEPIREFEKQVNAKRAARNKQNAPRREMLKQRVNHLTKAAAKTDDPEVYQAYEAACAELEQIAEEDTYQLTVTNSTTEALIDIMKDNGGRAAIFAAEGGIFDVMGGMYDKTGNIDPYLSGYNRETMIVNRKKGKLTIDEPYLTIGLSVQPKVAAEFETNPFFINKGLTARMITVYPDSMVGYRDDRHAPPIPKEVRRDYFYTVTGLLEHAMVTPNQNKATLRLSPGAKALYDDFKDALEIGLRRELEAIEHFAGKADALAVRLSALLHIGHYGTRASEKEIAEAAMADAITLTKYFIVEKLRMLEFARGDEHVRMAEYVRRRFRDSGEKSLSRSDLAQFCKGKIPKSEQMDKYLNLLMQHHHIKGYMTRTERGNCPQKRYALHPHFRQTA